MYGMYYSQLEGFDIKLSYPRGQLDHWRQIKRNAHNLLKCMKKSTSILGDSIMGTTLSDKQFSMHEAAKDADDRIEYYFLLADFGTAYGKLALSVVNNDAVGGQLQTTFS
ncbi:hypothetical protein HGO34_21190 [Agrobacterium vitis]|uniref:Uncharacterized protein n=1 Tax=Agrobacterium vitis TaxID=373 RepID=A0AAE4WEG8_AGRVI|nr:hypothetical protein [Agrobacterium vitis]MCF1500071.1 hypothetical protein [Allorhizobium sp. Av2]MCM2442244.1 hypothetical protein [Agrobacterium vitis]MUZ58654.1 hypothetical protein [Agrobacterium vitis]MVA66289.1 hypothetical protein [Agrobacterium vitis]MVA88326.1 hypothetical protein [Agrobacterium vitis]